MTERTADDERVATEWLRLVSIMRQLRDPETGCPWDVEQTSASIAPYTIEEAYEVVDAIERESWTDLTDELGDLALQVVFHAQMAAEAGRFTVEDVLRAISDKMVRRHPHVFADGDAADGDAVRASWERIKEDERAAKTGASKTGAAQAPSRLDDIPRALPGLMRAQKVQRRAASVGFDWPDAAGAFAKLDEETAELRDAQTDPAAALDELGDVLFSAVNVARKLGFDADEALRKATAKFERRFRAVESLAHSRGVRLDDCDEKALDALWIEAKRQENGG